VYQSDKQDEDSFALPQLLCTDYVARFQSATTYEVNDWRYLPTSLIEI